MRVGPRAKREYIWCIPMLRRSLRTAAIVFCIAGCQQRPSEFAASAEDWQDAFTSVDTSNTELTVGCGGDLFKLINDSCVLVIHTPPSFVDGIPLPADTANSPVAAELYLFHKDSAGLMNICTDIFITNAPRPVAKLLACKGEIAFKRHNPVKSYGNMRPVTSARVKHLTFHDPTGFRRIHVEDELLWRVVDLTPA